MESVVKKSWLAVRRRKGGSLRGSILLVDRERAMSGGGDHASVLLPGSHSGLWSAALSSRQ